MCIRDSFETAEDRAAFDKRKAEDDRAELHPRNRQLRQRADDIADKAPLAKCYRSVVSRTTTEVSSKRVKCDLWSCAHCSQTKTARILSEVVERFASCRHVRVAPLADDDARRKLSNRLKKRRQRLGIEAGALVIPVAGSGFLVLGNYADAEGELMPVAEAFDLLIDALAMRSEVARMKGTKVDKRRISRPGLEAVTISSEKDNSPVRTNGDKTEDRRPVGMIFKAVDADDLTELVAQHNGKRRGKARKGEWSYRFPTEAAADAFIADLERLYDLTTEDKLADTRSDRSDRIAWENQLAEVCA